MIINGYFLGPGAKMFKTEPERFTNRVEVAGLYWHFVDLVWIFLFPDPLPALRSLAMSASDVESIRKQTRSYIVVFVTLMVMTVLTPSR